MQFRIHALQPQSAQICDVLQHGCALGILAGTDFQPVVNREIAHGDVLFHRVFHGIQAAALGFILNGAEMMPLPINNDIVSGKGIPVVVIIRRSAGNVVFQQHDRTVRGFGELLAQFIPRHGSAGGGQCCGCNAPFALAAGLRGAQFIHGITLPAGGVYETVGVRIMADTPCAHGYALGQAGGKNLLYDALNGFAPLFRRDAANIPHIMDVDQLSRGGCVNGGFDGDCSLEQVHVRQHNQAVFAIQRACDCYLAVIGDIVRLRQHQRVAEHVLARAGGEFEEQVKLCDTETALVLGRERFITGGAGKT